MPTTTQSDGTILDRATIVSIQIGRLGIRRKVSSDRVRVKETTAQKADGETATQPMQDMIAVSKEILACEEYDAIVSLDGETRAKVGKLALPFKLRAGSHLIADGVLENVDQILEEYQTRREHLVDSFLRVYSVAQDEARQKLGDLYDPADYPHPDDVRDAFTVRVRYESWGAPQRLETLSQKIYHREQERTARELGDATAEIKSGMRAALSGLVGHLADVLQPGPDGKTKTFRNSTVENLNGWLSTFDARNIVDDDQLSRIVGQARELLDGADPESLRRAPMIQRMVRDGLLAVRQRLEQLTTTRGRRFNFDAADPVPTGPSIPAPPPDASAAEQAAPPAPSGQ